MQGSLDMPPIVIRSSRTMAALMFLISAGFVATGAFMLRISTQDRWIAWLVMGFFGLGLPLFAWRFIRPDMLTLAPGGITWRSIFRTGHWNWDDVRGFRPYKPSPKTISKHVGFDFTAGYGVQAQSRHLAKALTGVEGSLGSGWELDAAELCDLLDKARARWMAKGR